MRINFFCCTPLCTPSLVLVPLFEPTPSRAPELHLTPLGKPRNSPTTRLELPASEAPRKDPRPSGLTPPTLPHLYSTTPLGSSCNSLRMRLELPAPGGPGKDPPYLPTTSLPRKTGKQRQTFHKGISCTTCRVHVFGDMTKNLGNTGNKPKNSI